MSVRLVAPGSTMGIALLLLAGMVAHPVSAQQTVDGSSHGLQAQPQLGLGYVVNAPNMYLGFSAHALWSLWGGIGLYADAKFDLDSPKDERGYIGDLTVATVEEEIGDQFFREEDEWRSFNLALLRPLSSELMVYVGAGHSSWYRYREYIDSGRERGVNGFYWVRNEEGSGSKVNFLGGVFFRIGEAIALQFGMESVPRGATVGASYAIPLGF